MGRGDRALDGRTGLCWALCRQQPVWRAGWESTSSFSSGEEGRRGPSNSSCPPGRDNHPPSNYTSNFSTYIFFYNSFSPFWSFSSADSSPHLLRRREVSRCEAPQCLTQKDGESIKFRKTACNLIVSNL